MHILIVWAGRWPRRVAALLALALVGCCATSQSSKTSLRRRAVLLSFDGLGGVRLGELLAAGKLRAGGFAAFAERGVIAERAITVTPSLTSVAHIAAITGAPPSRTGIVANVYHRSGDPLGTTVSGFTEEIESETLWEAAMRQGKRVGVIVYPGADASNSRRRGSFGVIWPREPLRSSTVVTVVRDAWRTGRAGAGSFSPAQEATVDVDAPGGALRLRLEAVDTTDDGATNYDLVRVSSLDGAHRSLASVRSNGWFRIDAPGATANGAWCRLVALDAHLLRVVLYVGPFYGLLAYPEEYRRRLETEVGPWPGQPDALFLGGIDGVRDEAAYEEQSLRLSAYLARMLLFTMRTEPWDLLIHYEPAVDEVEHVFERGGARVAGETFRSGSVDERIERAFTGIDRELARILGELGPNDSVFIHSDHGMSLVDRAVDLERHLEGQGWRILRKGDREPAGDARRVQVCTASGIAHLYLPRDAAGRPSEEDLAALRRDVERLRSDAGVVFDAVLDRSGLASVGLDHPNAGDLVLLLRLGSVFERHPDGPISAPIRPRGAHGFRNTYPILDASYLSLGPGIRPGRPQTVSLLDVARSVAGALGIEFKGQ